MAAQMLDPKTLTVLITGATSGFGAAAARRYAQAGAKVIGTGRRQDRLDALKKELGANCHTLNFDVTDNAATIKALNTLPDAFKNVNVVVANAGGAIGLEPAHEAKIEDWDQMIAMNVNGLVYTIRNTLP
ncbi:MAG: SDR family NAD(P)-dependent oxidoreductase, partial [Xanthobacteraceae bacterium]